MTAFRIALVGVLALTLAPNVFAQGNPNRPQQPQRPTGLTLDARPNPVVFGQPTELSGRLTGGDVSGVAIRFEQDTTRPYGDSYQPTMLTATTANNGRYSLNVRPALNTQYRATAQSSPPLRGGARLVLVRTRVGLRLSDSTPSRGSRVRFSGSVLPAHDGRPALIQKRSPSGRFVTVARTSLRDAGTLRSAYSRRVRVYRDGAYRVKVPGDSDHVNGFSRTLSINVG